MANRALEGRNTILFYMQIRWNIEGRVTLDQVCDLEIEEGAAAKAKFKILGM
jgi:hypothetical protein